MAVANVLGHRLLHSLVAPGCRSFERQAGELESVQRGLLHRWLQRVARSPQGRRDGVDADWSWEDYARQMPVRGYADYAQALETQRRTRSGELIASPVMRYQPTSGSTSAVKWVPYTKQFLDEMDSAITAWVGDLYRQFPEQASGTHYWSLSWIPTELRQQTAGDINDDMKMLSLGKRALAYLTQAVPQEIALAQTSDDSLFTTLAWLASDEQLAFVSVWSPTFAIGALEHLGLWREDLAACLRSGDWGARRQRMPRSVRCPRSTRAAALLARWDGRPDAAFFRELWPRLGVLSSWDTAAAAPWAAKLRSLLPQARFQGKGLWATEGVVTIPFDNRFPLAYTSHVFEFEDVQTHRILPPWELQLGQEVIPILTTGSGFGRYRMSDVVRVDGRLGDVPCFTFLGRNDGVDLVGEKISATTAQQLLDSLRLPAGTLPVTLLALDHARGETPGYVLLAEVGAETATAQSISRLQQDLAAQVESGLQRHFHYQLARELGQLAAAQCVAQPRMRDTYLEQCRLRGMVEGNIKIEPLRHWAGDIPASLRQVLDEQAALAA